MTVTKILGEQSGIQYQGVVDKSEADPRDNLINALFTGEFKNGPFNKPFKVTQANIRAKLGFDPESLHYQAIQDALNTGVPFVWVMRVNGGKHVITCAGASPYADLWLESAIAAYEEVKITIEDSTGNTTTYQGRTYEISGQIQEDCRVEFYASCGGEISANNYSNLDRRVIVEVMNKDISTISGSQNNTMFVDQKNKIFYFCLSGRSVE